MAELRISRLAALGVLLFACLMAPAFAQERLTREVMFDIAAQSVEAALIEFSKQADVQVMVGGKLNGQKTEGVKGKLSVTEALTQLLKNTGLEYQTEGNNTVTIRSPASAKADAKVRPLVSGMTMARRGAQEEAATRNLPAREDGDEPTLETLDEVIVTGSHIRGQAPHGSQLISLTREDIDRSGFTTVHDLVRALPQNFGGGASEDTTVGVEAATNGARSTALNLRGLGAGATLVLINGRRLAPGGTEGGFTDVSSIPITAIQQIDVLADGSSAIYGSDAIGGVVNIRLRRDFSDPETFVRFGSVTDGELDELQVGQSFGTNWNSGFATLAYEYWDRSALQMTERRLTRSSDLTPLGGSNWNNLFGNPGTIEAGFDTWAIPPNQDGTNLDPAALTAGTANLHNRNSFRDLFGEQQRHSIYLAAEHALTDQLSFFADGLITRRDARALTGAVPASLFVASVNPFYVDPTGGTDGVFVSYSFLDDFGPSRLDVQVDTFNFAVGGSHDLPRLWQLRLQAAHAREKVSQISSNLANPIALDTALADPNPATAFNPFGDGSFTNPNTLATIRARSRFNSDSRLTTFNVSAEGPVWEIGGEDVRLAIGAEVRKPEFESVNDFPGFAPFLGSFDREIHAAYIETTIPLVGASNARAGLNRLSLSLAGRYEDYDDFGSATTPKVGMDWMPLPGLKLRANWSKSFKAPDLANLDESNNFSTILRFVPDPQSALGFSDVLVWTGKNRDLHEEEARSHTFGIEFAPERAPSSSIAVTYFDVSFTERIQDIPFTFTWLEDPRFAGVVTRNPSQELRNEVCNRSLFGGSPDNCVNQPIAAVVDLRVQNTAISEISGIDLLANLDFRVGAGSLNAQLNGTYLLDYSQALTRTDSLTDLRNTASNPIDLRLRGALTWTLNRVSISGFLNYADSYQDTVGADNERISSWTTADLQLAYQTPDGDGVLDMLTVALNVQNAFDEEPPFYDNAKGVGYDQENADLLGRFVSLQLRKRW